MTEKEAAFLKEGTCLRFENNENKDVGIFIYLTDKRHLFAPYFRKCNDYEVTKGWIISNWSMYQVMSNEEFILWKLENS